MAKQPKRLTRAQKIELSKQEKALLTLPPVNQSNLVNICRDDMMNSMVLEKDWKEVKDE